MAKRKYKLHFRIPPYKRPRNEWRYLIYQEASKKVAAQKLIYKRNDPLEVTVILYFKKLAIGVHDVDNRLKDILDALQGRMGGPKAIRKHKALIPNDNQIYRVTVTKKLPPKQSRFMGHVTIDRFNSRTGSRP